MRIVADTSMMNKPLDVSRMNIGWVQSTEDLLFRDLSKNDRYLLYLVYAREMSLKAAGTSLGCDSADVRKRLTSLLSGLQAEVCC